MAEEGATLTGPWAGLSKLLGRLKPEVDAAVKLATLQNAVGMVGALKTGLTSGTLLDGTKLAELHPFTVLRRLASVPLSQRDRALERMSNGKGAKPLYNKGDLARSFTKTLSADGWSAVVGVNRQAVTADGKSMVNIAKVQFYGASIRVTEKMRGWLAVNGLHLHADTTHITIPPRNPIPPTFRGYKPVMVKRYRDAMAGVFSRLSSLAKE